MNDLIETNNNDNGLRTNLSNMFENTIETNNTSIDSIDKLDDNMIESIHHSSDDNDNGVIPYELLYSNYIDVFFNYDNLLDEKNILEEKMMETKLENESLKKDVSTNKKELNKSNKKFNKLKQKSTTTSKLITDDNLEYLIQQNTKLDTFLNKILVALEKLGKQKNQLPETSSKTLVDILWNTMIWDSKIRLAIIDNHSPNTRMITTTVVDIQRTKRCKTIII